MSVPLIFLHGWAMSGAMFDDIAIRLGPEFDCHAPDLPAHGTRAHDEPSLKRCVEVLERVIDQLDRPVLVGWSMGAAVAWKYLAQHGSQDLRGLVTIDMSPRLLPDLEWTFGLGAQSSEAVLATSSKFEMHWHEMAGNILRNMFAPGRELTARENAIEALLLKQNPTTLRAIWDDLVAIDERQGIAEIDIPYLVCAGAESQLYDPGVTHWVASQAPKAEVKIFQMSGHSPHLEEPVAFCNAIRRFVEGLECTKTENKKTMLK